MTAIELSSSVAVVGGGTMGQGIAQVALTAGHPVRIFDAAPGRAAEAVLGITARLGRLVEKGGLSAAARDAAVARLTPVESIGSLADCAFVVEAIVEDLGAKRRLFTELEAVVAEDCLLATNTSSLPVTAVAGALARPGRFAGVHFFNPAPLLPLVEIVSGSATDETAARTAYDTVEAWGRKPVHCTDTAGFIVNRIARPFYAEALRVYEDRAADPATVDAVLRESGGFRMGPFELTDLIGQDVNETVTRSVWEAFFHDPKFTPSAAQRRLVESGRLGRKSGHGWYSYAPGAERPEPHTAGPAEAPESVVVHGDLGPARELAVLFEEAGVTVERREADGAWIELPGGGQLGLTDGTAVVEFEDTVYFDLALDYRAATRIALAASPETPAGTLRSAVGLFQAAGKKVSVIGDVPGMIVARTVAMLADIAADAAAKGVATPQDIDTAMRLGVNYPLGPLEWSERLGRSWAYDLLEAMHRRYPAGRYAPSLGLLRRAYTDEEAQPS